MRSGSYNDRGPVEVRHVDVSANRVPGDPSVRGFDPLSSDPVMHAMALCNCIVSDADGRHSGGESLQKDVEVDGRNQTGTSRPRRHVCPVALRDDPDGASRILGPAY